MYKRQLLGKDFKIKHFLQVFVGVLFGYFTTFSVGLLGFIPDPTSILSEPVSYTHLNNFMIPIALSGDRSYDNDNIRRYLMEGNKVIPGASSISFDEVSKKSIYNSINSTSFQE